MTTISKDKQYRTRDGREVRIYSTDGSPGWPVHGAYRNIAGEWQVEAWTANGTVFLDRTNNGDLIEVKPRVKGWVNLCRFSDELWPVGRIFASKKEADDYRGRASIFGACIPVDFEEGEGL